MMHQVLDALKWSCDVDRKQFKSGGSQRQILFMVVEKCKRGIVLGDVLFHTLLKSKVEVLSICFE